MWETLSLIADNQLSNMLTIVNANGWSAYRPVSADKLINRIKGFGCQLEVINATGPAAGYQHIQDYITHFAQTAPTEPQVLVLKTSVNYLPFLSGQAGHYHVMNDQEYHQAWEILK